MTVFELRQILLYAPANNRVVLEVHGLRLDDIVIRSKNDDEIVLGNRDALEVLTDDPDQW